jgi:exodeoxyribonuclease V gamma subunit
LTLHELGAFFKDPIGQFFEQRLGIRLSRHSQDSQDTSDHEPFELDALENWQLQDALIRAQLAAVQSGTSVERALQQGLDRLERSGALPVGAFGQHARQALAKPMAELFAEWQGLLQAWPHEAPDEPFIWSDAQVQVSDQITGLRRNAEGRRCRLLLESSSVVKKKHYRTDKLAAAWVVHVAGHLTGHLAGHLGGDHAGEPLTTVVVSKAGTATFAPLTAAQAQQAWSDLLQAWREGMTRPLPFVQRCSDAWWVSKMKPGNGDAKAQAAACKAYEHHDPAHKIFSERESNPCAARAFPDFAALWSAGEFGHWARTLLGPLRDALGAAPEAVTAPSGGAGQEAT